MDTIGSRVVINLVLLVLFERADGQAGGFFPIARRQGPVAKVGEHPAASSCWYFTIEDETVTSFLDASVSFDL